MKSVVILQSNYIPWKGYFDLIHDADEFILFDDMQYTRRDWRNRNQIKTEKGQEWLSIPVDVKGKFFQRIDETMVADSSWAVSHWQKIRSVYRRAPHFQQYAEDIEALYLKAKEVRRLSEINRLFLNGVARLLGLRANLKWSTDYPSTDGKTERLVQLCKSAGAQRYISGPAARGYIEPGLFEEAKVELVFKDYSGYPEYPQSFPPFAHGVTVLDLLFNVGPDAPWYIWGWREGSLS